MPVIPAQNYADIRPQFKTGDILSFEGSEGLDVLINLMEGGGYSHVGMVLRDDKDNLWFWDAPGNDIEFHDPYNKNAMHPGTRVANLDLLLAHYVSIMNISGFSWCQLTPNNPIDYAALVTWITANDGLPFPGDGATFPHWFTELIAKICPTLPAITLDESAGLLLTYLTGSVLHIPTTGYYFCAQLVAATYMFLGFLPEGPLPANGYAPSFFDSQPSPLPIQNATLSLPTPVLWNNYVPAPPTTALFPHATACKN